MSGRWWTIARKTTAIATAVSAVAGLAQWLALGRPVGGAHAVLAIGLPLAGCVLASWLYARAVVRGRSRAITQAYQQIAAGDFQAELPPAFFGELQGVRDMFGTMTRALADLTRHLQDADEQRRRLFADLAHELATPTSTMLGIVDALAHPDRLTAHDAPRLLATLAPTRPRRRLDRATLVQLVEHHGSIRRAALALGIPRSTLGARLRRGDDGPAVHAVHSPADAAAACSTAAATATGAPVTGTADPASTAHDDDGERG